MVSKSSETAGHTGEFGLRRTIGFIDVTASSASATGISWINQEHRDASTFSFVVNKITELVKSPTMQGCPLFATNHNPLTITRYPNQMVVDYIGTMWAVLWFIGHRNILAREGGFLHPLKRGGFRRRFL